MAALVVPGDDAGVAFELLLVRLREDPGDLSVKRRAPFLEL